jgi:protein disulfide-isomerase-like protein
MPDPADFRKFCSSLLFSKKLNNTIVLQHKQHMRAVVLALVALLAVVAANEFDSPWVINLTDENFDQLVTNQSSWMLEYTSFLVFEFFARSCLSTHSRILICRFYAPWCSHCKKLAPAYAAAAKASVDKLSFGKVDCTANSQLVKRFGIKGYPVLKFWRDGHYRSYRHERTEADMISFANSVTANPLKVAETAEQFDELIKDQPVSMLVLVPPANTRTKMVQLAEEVFQLLACF